MTPTLDALRREHHARLLAIETAFREKQVALAVEMREALETERVRFEMAVRGVKADG